MFQFLLNMWKMHRLTVEQVDAAVTLGRITAAQAEVIKAS